MTKSKTVLVNGRIKVTGGGKITRCRGCDAMIKFGRTESGSFIPYDLDENHTAHWATCKSADQFRGGDK